MKPKRMVPKIGFPSDYQNLSEKHGQILELSENLLGTMGLAGLELKIIASRLQVSPSLINHYYTNTETLVFDTVIYSYSGVIKKIKNETKYELNPVIVARTWIKEMISCYLWVEKIKKLLPRLMGAQSSQSYKPSWSIQSE